jgi:predicted ATP-binding protein involved in virulence
MKLKSISLEKFKRFTNLKIQNIPATAKLVVLTGPNGSGKSSLFEAFHFWARYKRGQVHFDQLYHSKEGHQDQHFFYNSINIEFYDFSPHGDSQENRKCFYIRSAYRHEADFASSGIQSVEDILNSPNKLKGLINQEARLSENYNRIVGEAVQELFDGTNPERTKIEIRDRLIGEVRDAMSKLFGDLLLSGTGNPTNDQDGSLKRIAQAL